MLLSFPAGRNNCYREVADKLDELADCISRLPEVDLNMIGRIRSFSAILRAEQKSTPRVPSFRSVDMIV